MNQMMMNQNMMNQNMMNQMNNQNMMNQMMMNPMAMMQMMQQNNNPGQDQTQTANNEDNSNSSNNAQSQKNEQPTGMSIIFRASGATGGQAGPPLTIQCLPDEKVSELIKRYRTKANDHDMSKKFIYNAKALNETLSAAEAGLTNNSNVFVVTTKGVKGA